MSFLFKDEFQKLEKNMLALKNKNQDNRYLNTLLSYPLPDKHASVEDLSILSLDFETTGLNFQKDVVISFGGVLIEKGQIIFNSSFHHLIKVDNDDIKNNEAIVNHITPEMLENGIDKQSALDILIDKIKGKVILTHGHIIEQTFLLKLMGLDNATSLPLIFLDTMQIEHSLLKSMSLNNLDLRLFAIRQKRGFPSYVAHNALADCVATAEVFLAQVKDIFGKDKSNLLTLYKRSI